SKRDSYGYDYDDFGNVLTVETDNYGLNTDTSALELANYTVTTNTFLNEINRRRGNPDETITITYDKKGAGKVQLRKTTTQSTFNDLGNVLTQTTETRLGADEKLDTKVVTVNDPNEIDAAGNAGVQYITTYKTDNDGNIPTEEIEGVDVEIANSYVVKTNRTFDSTGNVMNETNFHYTKEGGQFVKMEEIRSSLHHTSGVAGEQVIVSWNGTDRTEDPASITKIENLSITADGNVKSSVVSTYTADEVTVEAVYEIEGDDTSAIVDYDITLGDASKRDTITVTSFYNVGTAKEQTILTQHYKEGAWSTGTLQKISNVALDGTDGVDWRGRVTASTTTSYKGATEASGIESKRDSYGYDYDDFGNVLTVETDNYGLNTDTSALELANYTVTTNTFLN
ncbi:MAG: hypothetical protein GY861_18695, partial [bacterium]|nr:hypothetical protein [bacterium]